MTESQSSLPKWILVVSAIFALLEIMVSLSLWFSPESVVNNMDLNAKGVDYLIYMWAVRQFALGFIFAFATIKRSASMLIIAYVFFLVMMVGDLLVGIILKETALIMSASVMIIISSALIYVINRNNRLQRAIHMS